MLQVLNMPFSVALVWESHNWDKLETCLRIGLGHLDFESSCSLLFSSEEALGYLYPVHNIKICIVSLDFFMTLNKVLINVIVPYEVTRGKKKKKRLTFGTWGLNWWFQELFLSDVALCKNHGGKTLILCRVPLHLSGATHDLLQLAINQSLNSTHGT